jgi:hypothetical protein
MECRWRTRPSLRVPSLNPALPMNISPVCLISCCAHLTQSELFSAFKNTCGAGTMVHLFARPGAPGNYTVTSQGVYFAIPSRTMPAPGSVSTLSPLATLFSIQACCLPDHCLEPLNILPPGLSRIVHRDVFSTEAN